MMRKVFCLLTALMLCLTLTVPAFAADAVYVPSITAKPAPELNTTVQDDAGRPVIQVKNEEKEVVHSSPVENLVITSVAEVMAEEYVRISEEAQNTLKEAFEVLETKGAETFAEIPELVQQAQEANVKVENLVVVDLFDVTILNEELEKYLNVEGHTVELTFARDIPADQQVYVMVFKENKWQLIENVVNNGDGTITCTFEHFCPVAILTVPPVIAEETEPVEVPAAQTSFPWWIVLVVAVAVILLLVIKGKKSKNKV